MSEHTVEAYYDNTRGAVILHTTDDIDRLIDQLLTEPFDNSVAALYSKDRPLNPAGVPDHQFMIAVNAEDQVGTIRYTGEGWTWNPQGTRSRYEELYYCYMGNEIEFPRDAELTLDQVREAAHQFLTSRGARPTIVGWEHEPDPLAEANDGIPPAGPSLDDI